jgi:hypothetical protein
MKNELAHLDMKTLQTRLDSFVWFYRSGKGIAPERINLRKWEVWRHAIRGIGINDVIYDIEELYFKEEEALSLYVVDLGKALLDTQCKVGKLTSIKE